jgi:WD40 repeat protein
MKAKIKVEKEVEIKTLSVKAGVRYWADATVNGIEDETGELIPCRDGDYWCPEIDIQTGVIINWEKDKTAKVHYKVCDDGTYYLKDSDGNILITKEGYVPNILDVDRESYGDYIIMNIDVDGKIDNWDNETDIFDFMNDED